MTHRAPDAHNEQEAPAAHAEAGAPGTGTEAQESTAARARADGVHPGPAHPGPAHPDDAHPDDVHPDGVELVVRLHHEVVDTPAPRRALSPAQALHLAMEGPVRDVTATTDGTIVLPEAPTSRSG